MKTVKHLFILLIFLCCIVGNASAAKANESALDKVYSDKYVLGYEKKQDADVFEDLSVKNAESVATSLPTWAVMALAILLVAIVVTVMVVLSLLWNTGKMAKAATEENADEASRKIHKRRKNNNELMEGVTWAVVFLGFIAFVILYLR
jgi:preprotein translocase subunit SecG